MKRIIVFLMLGLMLMGLVGCTLLGTNKEDATLAIYLADAPVNDVQNVFVTIEKVEIHNEELGWITLNDFEADGGEKTFDLLTLRFDEALLGQQKLEPGIYTQLRLVVAAKEEVVGSNGAEDLLGKSYVVFKDETSYDLFIPSGTATGLKINLNDMVVEEGVVIELVLDTDVREVMKTAGNIEKNPDFKIILHPTAIRVVEKVITGDVEGRVTDVDGNPIIPTSDTSFDVVVEVLNQNQEVVASTVASAEDITLDDQTVKPAGSFLIRGLTPGTYTINAYAEDVDGNILYQMVQVIDPVSVEVVADTTTILPEDIHLEAVTGESQEI